MTKRCIFILFCAAAPFRRIPTVDPYTAIAVASSNSNGGVSVVDPVFDRGNCRNRRKRGEASQKTFLTARLNRTPSETVPVTVESILKLWSRQGNLDILSGRALA
jgi:hypothetical protein